MSQYKKDFPIFAAHPSLVYLDTAATAHKPKSVLDAMYRFDSTSYATIHRAVYKLAHEAFEMYNGAKEAVKDFLSAKHTNEIVFTKGTTESINLLASSFPQAFMQKGDHILITEAEHHSNLVPWQIAKEKYGVELKYIPLTDDGEIDLKVYQSLLCSKTKLVSLAHVSNTLSTTHPIKEIISYAHEVGAKVLVDAAQSAPHIPIDVQDLDVDFLVFSAHKLYGPTGLGVLYGKEDLLDKLPPYQTGGSMVESVSLEQTSFSPLPLKFEAGTPPITQSVGLKAAIDYIQNISLDVIHNHEKALVQKAYKLLSTIDGITILGHPDSLGSLISFDIDKVHPLDIGTMLSLKDIAIRTGHQCSQPTMKKYQLEHVSRISFGIYNSLEDVDIFHSSLLSVLNKLR